MTLQIRKATFDDVQPLLAIFTQANQYKVDHGDRAWVPGFSESGVNWMIGLDTTYAAYLDDTMVGTVALEWEDAEGWGELETGQAGYVHRLAIHNDHHGRGLGGQIIDWCSREVASKGRILLRLDCNVTNTGLCAYYEKQGFKQVATKDFPDHNYTAALYERPA